MKKSILRKITAAGVALVMLIALAPGMGLANAQMNFGVAYHSNAPGLKAPRTVTITYKANLGDNQADVTDSINKGSAYALRANPFANPRTHTFVGWNTQANGSGKNYKPGKAVTVNGNKTLYAQWKIINLETVTITYKINIEGDSQADVTDTVNKGSAYTLRANPFIARTGYIFEGWNTQPNGSGTSYQPDKTLTVNGDHTLYAQWRIMPIRFFTITYIANAGDDQADVIYTFDVNKGYGELMNSPFTHTGYIFTGWNTQANGSGTSYQPGQTLTANMDYTLYAQWRSVDTQTVTITYKGGGMPEMTDTVTKDSYYTIKPYPYMMIAIYTFLGWNTQPNGTGIYYQPEQVITANADLTLYAQWRLV